MRHYVNSFAFQLVFVANVIHNLVKNFYYEEWKRISFEEYVILDTITCYPNTDKDSLAKTLFKGKDAIEENLAVLVNKKILEEKQSKNTAAKHYKLTDYGMKIYEEIVPANDKIIELFVKFITEKELLNFTKTLLKIKKILISLEYV